MRCVDPHLPKELLTIGARPAIDFALSEGVHAGVDRIVVVVSPRKPQLREHLAKITIPLCVVEQTTPRGEADALALSETVAGGGVVAVIYPDNVYFPAPGALARLLRVHAAQGRDVIALSAIGIGEEAAFGNAGRVDLHRVGPDLYQITRFLPKGNGTFVRRFPNELRACGLMVTGPHLFDVIRRARPLEPDREFTDEPVKNLLVQQDGLLGVHLPGRVFDIGNPTGYQQCCELATHRTR